ncbi:MAG TPA: restriction endonuclease subunit S [Tissierellales bacterium]|nr:restriction endonuclease subunit S [Tissierellales bacterium]
MTEKLIPELRFPGFSGEWEEKKLGDVSYDYSYGMNSAADKFDGINKYIRITDIDEKTNNYNQSDLVSPKNKIEDKYLLDVGDLLFARTGASVGKSYYYKNEDGKVYYAGFLIRFRIKKEFDYRFIFYNTLTSSYSNWVKIMSVRSGQPGINAKEYSSMNIAIPSLEEQKKIANFFHSIDKKLQLQKKKIGKLKEYKKSMMQRIFSQEIRFKDENGNDYPEWEEKKIGDVLIEVNNKSSNCNLRVLSSTIDGVYYQDKYFKNRIASSDTSNYKILKINQIVFSPQNIWMGNINFNDSIDIGIVSPSYKILEVNGEFDKLFIKYLIKTPRLIYEYKNSSEQGASVVRRNLNMKLFNNIKVEIPLKEEQTKIANFLSSIDKKISLEEGKLQMQEEYKRGLMQRMFI